MQWLIFWLVYPFLWLISKLPFRLLYLFSDFVCFIIYRLVGYRKKTVRYNLNMAFPGLAESELKKIEKRFYSHMCDMFLEMIKSISISSEELKKRFVFSDLSIIEKLEEEQRSSMIVMGHYASYEWLSALQFYFNHTGYGIYKRIKSKPFDKLVRDIRSRWNSELISNKEASSVIRRHKNEGRMATYGFIADQAPKSVSNHYVTSFLGHRVPFYTGVERLAKNMDMPVLYLRVKKLRRGYYEATFDVLSEKPETVPDYEITEAFVKRLESQIKNAPEYYLWTHKRFKHVLS